MARHKAAHEAETQENPGGDRPSLGALVWYYAAAYPADPPPTYPGPLAAFVCALGSTETSVNLMVLEPTGVTLNRTDVLYVKEGDSSMGNEYCAMPGVKAAEPEQPEHPIAPAEAAA